MTTIYLIDGNGIFIGSEELVDVYEPLPRCTLTPPPACTGKEVAQWSAGAWSVLPEYPPQSETPPEQQWFSIRTDRNARLAACDWTQLPDAPVDSAAWAVYRQELRDITEQPDPFNIAWPVAPGA